MLLAFPPSARAKESEQASVRIVVVIVEERSPGGELSILISAMLIDAASESLIEAFGVIGSTKTHLIQVQLCLLCID